MKIALIEAFFSGSHKSWALGLQQFSEHRIEIFSLTGKYWKWRMQGGAISLANQLLGSKFKPELILATDILNLPLFISLIRPQISAPIILYFHENQLGYPWSPSDPDTENQRDLNYHFINYSSALCSDWVFFNSKYHKQNFFLELEKFLRVFPDQRNFNTIELIKKKSKILHLGLDLTRFDSHKSPSSNDIPVILWNHRWEYDKNPDTFFKILYNIAANDIPFKLVVLGEKYARSPSIFDEAKHRLKKEIIHFGFVDSFEEYAHWLWLADVYPVTSNQDFFGISVVEALYTDSVPLLPNRLSYPEHLPDNKSWCIYKSPKELEDKLISLLTGKIKVETSDVRQHVSRYDWRNIITSYDDTFNKTRRTL